MTFPDHKTLHRLYFWLGLFTDLYLILVAFEFFTNLHLRYPAFEQILDALSEPYLGALAVYVVLKEIHKHRTGGASLHRGEWFVVAWLMLLGITTVMVAFTERYRVDLIYTAVIESSLGSLMIYIGSKLHKP